MSKAEVGLDVTVIVEINDESVVTRCVENHDEDGQPQPDERGGRGWRNLYYPLIDREDVLEHLAYNAAVNHASDVSELDGWGDLPKGAATMRVDGVLLDWISEA